MSKNDHGRDLSGSEMAQMLDEFCNKADREDIAAFVEQVTMRTHRTLQQAIMRLFIATIEAWATQKNFDGRNEATIKLCKRIIEATGDKYDRCLPRV